jgi:signal transduction histidine kinase
VDLEDRIRQRTAELSLANEILKREIRHREEAESAILDISNREQRRLGQDLHDGLCQILAGVKFMAQSVGDEMIEASLPQSKKMAIIESRLAEALTFVDTVSRGLYPVELEASGLVAALNELSTRTSRVFSVACSFRAPEQFSIGNTAIATHVYRIAQEAVANALKGGHAKRIRIRLLRENSGAVLSVVDNGVGFGNRTPRKGMGMKIMEYRASVIGGALKVRSRPRGGTLLQCTFMTGEDHGR